MWTWNDFRNEAYDRVEPEMPLVVIGEDYSGTAGDVLLVEVGATGNITNGQYVLGINQEEGDIYGQDLLDALDSIVEYYGSGDSPLDIVWDVKIPKTGFFGIPLRENVRFECEDAEISWGDEDNTLVISGTFKKWKDSVQSSLSSM